MCKLKKTLFWKALGRSLFLIKAALTFYKIRNKKFIIYTHSESFATVLVCFSRLTVLGGYTGGKRWTVFFFLAGGLLAVNVDVVPVDEDRFCILQQPEMHSLTTL